MKGIRFVHRGDYSATMKFLNKILDKNYLNILEKYGSIGVSALAAATPVRTGKTAASWQYKIVHDRESSSIEFENTNVQKGENIALLIQFGHGTRGGGYVKGRDYINPALRPVFDKLAKELWEEVNK